VPNDAAEVLQSTSIWHLPGGERHGEFRTVTEQTPFASGIGLPGGIWASGKAAWIVNVQEDPNYTGREWLPPNPGSPSPRSTRAGLHHDPHSDRLQSSGRRRRHNRSCHPGRRSFPGPSGGVYMKRR
jgi:hypothetical protein